MIFKKIEPQFSSKRMTLLAGAIVLLGLQGQGSVAAESRAKAIGTCPVLSIANQNVITAGSFKTSIVSSFSATNTACPATLDCPNENIEAPVSGSKVTTYGANPTLTAQTLELRDSSVPAKTLDESGLKQLEDPLSKKPTQVLEGVLKKDELTGHVTLSADKKTLTLYAVNHGKRALIFSGDQATVTSASSAEGRTLTRNEVVSPPRKTEVPKDVFQVAVSIVSDGAVPTIYDLKTSYQADGTAYYGKDQKRRNVAERRFGQRTLFPGESTTGRIYLPENVTAPTQLTIPIIVHPSGESLGNIVLPVISQ